MRAFVFALLGATALTGVAFTAEAQVTFGAPSAPLTAQEKSDIHAEAARAKAAKAAARRAREKQEAAMERKHPKDTMSSSKTETAAPVAPMGGAMDDEAPMSAPSPAAMPGSSAPSPMGAPKPPAPGMMAPAPAPAPGMTPPAPGSAMPPKPPVPGTVAPAGAPVAPHAGAENALPVTAPSAVPSAVSPEPITPSSPAMPAPAPDAMKH